MIDFTPGPWRQATSASSYVLVDDDSKPKVIVARAMPNDIRISESETVANACLIAASPALYEALHFARSVIKSGEPWTETCENIIGNALALVDEEMI